MTNQFSKFRIVRLSLFFFLHLVALVILLIVHPHAKAAGEWLVEDAGSHVVTSVSGEVIHGDKLKFILNKKNCDEVGVFFTFMTTKAHDSIKSLEGTIIPIQINDLPAIGEVEVWIVKPFLKFGHLVLMSAPGPKNLEKFSNALMLIYSSQNKFEIKLLNENGFNPNKYFDLTENNWILDKYPENIDKAHKICTGKSSTILRS